MTASDQQGEWIEHDGKGMPVDPEIIVEVRFRDGTYWANRFAGSLNRENENFWRHEPTSSADDIIAYRVVPQS